MYISKHACINQQQIPGFLNKMLSMIDTADARPTPQTNTLAQTELGNEDDSRITALHNKAKGTLAKMPGGALTKPKQVLDFAVDIEYKKVGGTQLSANCMFCLKSRQRWRLRGRQWASTHTPQTHTQHHTTHTHNKHTLHKRHT